MEMVKVFFHRSLYVLPDHIRISSSQQFPVGQMKSTRTFPDLQPHSNCSLRGEEA